MRPASIVLASSATLPGTRLGVLASGLPVRIPYAARIVLGVGGWIVRVLAARKYLHED